jgi:hypothetical protein
MSLLFLAPLIVTLGSGCVFKAAKDTSTETATVAFAVGLIGLAFTLILSPWEVQLLLVVLLLANVKWVTLLDFLFSRREDVAPVGSARDGSEATASTISASAVETNSMVETGTEPHPAEKVVLGKYRGAICELGQPVVEQSPHQPTVELQYRGAKVR